MKTTISAASVAACLLLTATNAMAQGDDRPIVVDANYVPATTTSPARICVTTPFQSAWTTIQAGVEAARPGQTVLVCLGTYPELVTIKQSLTLRGVNNVTANAGAAVITLPNSGAGLPPNYWDTSVIQYFAPAVAQVLVEAPNVTLSNLTVDGSNTFATTYPGCTGPSLIGIVFTGVSSAAVNVTSSGTVNRVAVRNQAVNSGAGYYCATGPRLLPIGVGILADENANAVSILNSSIHGFDYRGIWLYMPAAAAVSNNVVTGISSLQGAVSAAGIELNVVAGGQVNNNIVESCSGFGLRVGGATQAVTVSSNTISTGPNVPVNSGQGVGIGIGIVSEGNYAAVTISSNTVTNSAIGIRIDQGGPSRPGATVQYNRISAVAVYGVFVWSTPPGPATVTGNTISDAGLGVVSIGGLSGVIESGNTFVNVATLTTF